MNEVFRCALGAGLCVAVASGCASTTYTDRRAYDDRMGNAVGEPFKDFGVTREDPPEILKRAAIAPYAMQNAPECGALLDEIAAIDGVLGPDLDVPNIYAKQSGTDPAGLAADAIRSVIGLPFRGAIRWMSGAGEREKVLANAILAGMVRRAYLKGAARSAGCLLVP